MPALEIWRIRTASGPSAYFLGLTALSPFALGALSLGTLALQLLAHMTRLDAARLVDQGFLTMGTVLTTPGLNRRLAGDAVLDHHFTHAHAVLQTVLDRRKLELERIHAMRGPRIHHRDLAAGRIGACPLTCRGVGDTELRCKGTMPRTGCKNLYCLSAYLGVIRAPCFLLGHESHLSTCSQPRHSS